MREILFRGKRIDNGEWVEGFYGLKGENTHCIMVSTAPEVGYHGCYFTDYVVDPATVGQYTGLKDINGKSIFEGDVVGELHYSYGGPDRNKGYNKVFQVSMDDDRRGWYPFACGDGCGCCETDTIWPDGCDVIGNIHDNPELLKEDDHA